MRIARYLEDEPEFVVNHASFSFTGAGYCRHVKPGVWRGEPTSGAMYVILSGRFGPLPKNIVVDIDGIALPCEVLSVTQDLECGQSLHLRTRREWGRPILTARCR